MFFPDLDAADVFPLDTYCYTPSDMRLQEIDGMPIFSFYVVDGGRYSEFHREHWLGLEFDGDWRLDEANVQKVYTEPTPSLRQRLFGSR